MFRGIWTDILEITKKEGYFPRGASILGITTLAGIANQWGAGVLSEDKRYFANFPELTQFYALWEPKNEIISLAFKDDMTLLVYGNVAPIDGWCEVHTKARITRVFLSPEEVGQKEVNHVGMFKEGKKEVWEMICDIAVEGKLPDRGEIRRWNQGKAKL